MARPGGALCGKDGDICQIGRRAYTFSPLKIVGKDQPPYEDPLMQMNVWRCRRERGKTPGTEEEVPQS